jgi:hypothetical protein
MPALKCPRCGFCELHAIDVENTQQQKQVTTEKTRGEAKSDLKQPHRQELGCQRCGWSPSKVAERDLALVSSAGKPEK